MVRERLMLILVSMLLLAVGLGLLALTGLLLILKVWLLAIIRLLEGRFIKAGMWLCLSIMLVNLFLGDDNIIPLCVAIMVTAVSADVWKLVHKPSVELLEYNDDC
jgi:hypothetical protein